MRYLVMLSAMLVAFVTTAFAQLPTAGQGRLVIRSDNIPRVVELFRQLAALDNPRGATAGRVECGYIFPGDSSKFGCKGTGSSIGDIAAACRGGGQFACTGTGSNRTCVCAFD